METEGSLPCPQEPAWSPCVTFRNKLVFKDEFLAPCPTPKLHATAYSIYLLLPYKFGGRLLHPQPEDAPCHDDRDPLNMVLIPIYSQLPSISGGRLLHPQPEDAPCYSDRDPLNMILMPIYSHLPSISGGRLLHPQPEDAPCRGDRDPLNMVLIPVYSHLIRHSVSTIVKQLPSFVDEVWPATWLLDNPAMG
jgi:hypothetical protein